MVNNFQEILFQPACLTQPALIKGSFISIKMEEWTPLPKIATKKLPKIVLEESIGIGVLAYDYITYLVAANPHSET